MDERGERVERGEVVPWRYKKSEARMIILVWLRRKSRKA